MRSLVMPFLLLSMATWSQQAPSPGAGKPAATVNRYAERCLAHKDLGTCSDAVRWTPGDATLLAALGDALMRTNRPADALREYRRAAAIEPRTPGVAEKITAAEAKLSAKRASGQSASARGAAGKHYSNSAPEAQSH